MSTSGPWRISRDRQWRKWRVAVFGRLGRPRQPRPEPKFRRPSVIERLAFWELAEKHVSARQIARQVGRDHHTVLRHLSPVRGQALAFQLALRGYRRQALDLAARLGPAEHVTEVTDMCAELDRIEACNIALRSQLASRLAEFLCNA